MSETPKKRATRKKAPIEAGGAIHNPALYAEMAAPFATPEEADAAMGQFLQAVRELRIRLRIADVVTVVAVFDDKSRRITWGQNGDATLATPLLAWALGTSERYDKTRIDALRERGLIGSPKL